MHPTPWSLVVVLVTALSGAAAAQTPLTAEQQLAFLGTAKIVNTRPIGKGTTGALRVTLSDGALTHDAAFQSIDETPGVDGKRRAGEFIFVDHYRYNVAAYRLAAHLGLGAMMPATVERVVEGKRGALAWWIDDVAMDEGEREARDAQPANALDFTHQRQRMQVFAELVRDTDRNKGNVVYTHDWRVVMLDFTRAFRLQASLRAPGLLAMCDRRLLAALKALTRDDVQRVTDGTLNGGEVKALMTRRDLIVAHYERLVAARGESAVLY